jgi:LuxR family maltose regulon positive regulatory protein
MRALDAQDEPTLLVIDDVHRLHDRNALDLLVTLADRYPGAGRIALVARPDVGLPLSRWRLAGRASTSTERTSTWMRTSARRSCSGWASQDAGTLASAIHQRTEGWALAPT